MWSMPRGKKRENDKGGSDTEGEGGGASGRAHMTFHANSSKGFPDLRIDMLFAPLGQSSFFIGKRGKALQTRRYQGSCSVFPVLEKQLNKNPQSFGHR